jgi:hypothetical protein
LGAGVSSTTFWLRRCRTIALAQRQHAAAPSPKICTSMWRASVV